MTDIRFTATTSSYETHLFRTEDDFLAHLDTLWRTRSWGGGRFEAERLRDPEPARYPCLMLTAGTETRRDGPDRIHNVFLYDVEIHEGEADNAWRLETADAA